MAFDMVDGAVDAVDQLHRHDPVEIFGVPVVLGRRHDPPVDRLGRAVAADFHAGFQQVAHDRRQMAVMRLAVDQQGLRSAADAAAGASWRSA